MFDWRFCVPGDEGIAIGGGEKLAFLLDPLVKLHFTCVPLQDLTESLRLYFRDFYALRKQPAYQPGGEFYPCAVVPRLFDDALSRKDWPDMDAVPNRHPRRQRARTDATISAHTHAELKSTPGHIPPCTPAASGKRRFSHQEAFAVSAGSEQMGTRRGMSKRLKKDVEARTSKPAEGKARRKACTLLHSQRDDSDMQLQRITPLRSGSERRLTRSQTKKAKL